jgi:U3 small nucleolar RNA-associated protein 20
LQEHVDLLRQLTQAFPARFPDLLRLSDADPELDFFNNVAHLQLHRRSRAFARLRKVRYYIPPNFNS